MNDALGMVETRGLATGIKVADVMVKTANVKLIDAERTKGHGWITIKVMGDVAAVNAAVSAGKKKAEEYGHFVSSKVIPRPVDAVKELFCVPPEKEEPEKKETPAKAKAEPVKKETPAKAKAEPVKKEAPAKAKAEPVKKEAPAKAKAEPVKKEAPVKAKAEPVKKEAPAKAKAEPVKNEAPAKPAAVVKEEKK